MRKFNAIFGIHCENLVERMKCVWKVAVVSITTNAFVSRMQRHLGVNLIKSSNVYISIHHIHVICV